MPARDSKKKSSRKQSKKHSKKGGETKATKQQIEKEKEKVDEYVTQLYRDEEDGKKIYNFWTFVDDPRMKKLPNTTLPTLRKKAKANPDLYKNRRIANVTTIMSSKGIGYFNKITKIYISLTITIYYIDNNCKIEEEQHKTATISWRLDDFKVSKLTYKLIKRFLDIIAKGQLFSYPPYGMGLKATIEDMNIANIEKEDLSDVLIAMKL